MGNLLFSPSGRINPSDFMRGVTVLIVISLILGLLPIFVPALGMLSIIGIVLLWCWIVLWVKRYHDAGKSGWMTLVPIIAFIIVGMIVGFIMKAMFTDPNVAAAIEAATAEQDFGAIFKQSMSGGLTKMGQIVNVLVGAAYSYVLAMVFNGMIKRDDHENQFGPAS